MSFLPDSGLFGADGSSEEGRCAVLECKQPICSLSLFFLVSLENFEQLLFHEDEKFGLGNRN